jgi:hypothetical protein
MFLCLFPRYANKQASKQLLHAVLSASPKHWRSFLDECQPTGSASTQLLSAIQPHQQLPHPYGSVTATCMAFQILERLLQHLIAQQQNKQPQAGSQYKVKQEQLQAADGPDEQQSRDTNTAATSAQHAEGSISSPQQLQLLCQLHTCAGLCWQAIVAKPGDLSLARHVLQYHSAAQSCLVLIHTYCRTAGIGQQLQELLVSLLLHGSMLTLCPTDEAAGGTAQTAAKGLVLVKQESSSQTSNAADQVRTQDLQHAQQLVLKAGPAPKQAAVPLLAGLKALMRSSKAHAAATKAAQRAAKTSASTSQLAASAGPKGATRSPAPAAAASPAGPLQASVSAASAARAEELTASGIKAWGLVAAELGPTLLDRAVGQPMLDVRLLAAGRSGPVLGCVFIIIISVCSLSS